MFAYAIIACVVYRLDGSPSNACFPFMSEAPYATEALCMKQARVEMDSIRDSILERFPDAAPVTTAACIQVSKEL